MNRDNIRSVLVEIGRLETRAREYLDRRSSYSGEATKEGGALRRASLDLTRALAKMRREP